MILLAPFSPGSTTTGSLCWWLFASSIWFKFPLGPLLFLQQVLSLRNISRAPKSLLGSCWRASLPSCQSPSRSVDRSLVRKSRQYRRDGDSYRSHSLPYCEYLSRMSPLFLRSPCTSRRISLCYSTRMDDHFRSPACPGPSKVDLSCLGPPVRASLIWVCFDQPHPRFPHPGQLHCSWLLLRRAMLFVRGALLIGRVSLCLFQVTSF